MEVAGLALGVLGIAIAFKGAVDSALFIESFYDDENTDCSYLALNYHIQKTRLRIWGDECVMKKAPDGQPLKLRGRPQYVVEQIVRILKEIEKLNVKATDLADRYNINPPDLPSLNAEHSANSSQDLTKALSRLKVKPASRFRWTIKKKAEFQTIIERLRTLISDLENFTLAPEESQVLSRSLGPLVLTTLNEPELVKHVDDPRVKADPSLALSARAKCIQRSMSHGQATVISSAQLRLLHGSLNFGLLVQQSGKRVPVLLEWTIIQTTSDRSKYIDRINTLGCILEKVSEPALRLPPCYGIYHDSSYEIEHPGLQRFGYVFGAPSTTPTGLNTGPQYDKNLHLRPPKSLSTRIKDQKNIPLLGDRFRLAYNLATAFSCFHAAGWLHKGLHSNNILYFERVDNSGIDEMEPFITGFQYSRPQQTESLSMGPLGDPHLDHYYHPDVEKGFTKSRDLYGLGVILCEIGRWSLLSDLPERRLQNLLSEGVLTSTQTVALYLAQIAKHNHQGLKINAVISIREQESLQKQAQKLDEERANGKARGPFHGVPIIIKDICTTVDLPSTCGSYALEQGKARADANIIKTLNDAGLIIIAKANLSEFGNAKGSKLMGGWSALGGQTRNAHVEGEIPPGAPFLTSWGPAGSSSGSATSVTAGFAPVSTGTELHGSITAPAARAGLYAIKLSPGSVDQTGFQPAAPGFDCQGPYGKTTADVAILSAIMQVHAPDHYLPFRSSWEGLRVGFVEPKLWRSKAEVVEQIESFLEQTDNALYAAQETIEKLGAKVARGVPLTSWYEIVKAMPDINAYEELFLYQMKKLWPGWLALWEGSPQTIEELIEWNNSHRDLEFNDVNDNQKTLEAIRDCAMTEDQYKRNSTSIQEAARAAVLKILEDVGSASGYPVRNLPLGYADFNGRAFSLHAVAPAGKEQAIFHVMAAWEATFPENVRPPRVLTHGL
ncbi:amidase signature domain-containing protein [Stachybotrys elegans]|uniref:Amidase signature domain-containing protein n=1 Tax=Stachybotrys elegans TaxID=80388 RepID=A0A8K0WX96_9HYPO|nr:amidase signature domain-containing protein [Stachybotrys elegans]